MRATTKMKRERQEYFVQEDKDKDNDKVRSILLKRTMTIIKTMTRILDIDDDGEKGKNTLLKRTMTVIMRIMTKTMLFCSRGRRQR